MRTAVRKHAAMLTAQTRTVADAAPSRWSHLAFVPLLAIGALWGWLVPYGFVAMWLAHDTQVDEIGQIAGFEVVERRVELFAAERGGQLLLRPVDATAAELIEDLVVLGYRAGEGDRAELSRARSDRFAAETVSIVQADGETLSVEVSVVERDLTGTWWIITIVCGAAGGVLYALALGARRPRSWNGRAVA